MVMKRLHGAAHQRASPVPAEPCPRRKKASEYELLIRSDFSRAFIGTNRGAGGRWTDFTRPRMKTPEGVFQNGELFLHAKSTRFTTSVFWSNAIRQM